MSGPTGTKPPDYLIIGHITKDQIDGGYRLGGTAMYSGVLAHRLGLRVAVYTSGSSYLNLNGLEGIDIIDQPGPGTTTFINEYSPAGRVQRLIDRAAELDISRIPPVWTQARIIHLAPVAGEIPLSAGQHFTTGSLGYSLQGWMRAWDEEGRVTQAELPVITPPPGMNAAGFLSIEDLGNDRSGLERIRRQFPTLLLTLGSRGVELITSSGTQRIPAPATPETDPTGAGDIFAAAYLTFRKIRGMPAEQAARLANRLAAASIKQPGLEGIPGKKEIVQLLEVQE